MKSDLPKICFVGNMLGRNAGYITTQGQILADLFSAEGFDVTCVSSKLNRAARLAEIVFTIVSQRRNLDVVIVEVYSGASFAIADTVGLLCRIFRIPLIMVLHGGNLPEFAAKHRYRTRKVFSYADFLVAPSQYLADKLGVYGYEIGVVPNVIELDSYNFRERAEISPRLLWMRSFHSIYNPQMAVKVLAELMKDVPQATLTMAGADKGLQSKTRKLAEDLNVSAAINFAGFLSGNQKLREFQQADIYLNTNQLDNLPVSVIEACACGLPVVATDVGGLPYLIDSGENGFLIENENVGAMVKAVKTLLEDSEITRRISNNARKSAEKFAWKNVRKDWENLFDKARRRKSAGAKSEDLRCKTAL